MKTKIFFILIFNLIICLPLGNLLISQNITNTLGTSGVFTLNDNATTYLALNQLNGHLSLYRSLVLPNTTSSALGVIYKGSSRFIHNFGLLNTFVGSYSGNFSMTGGGNTAFGVSSLTTNSSGTENTALGLNSLYSNTDGGNNTASGSNALFNNQTGWQNTAIGMYSLYYNLASVNTAVGSNSLFYNSTGTQNTAMGFQSLFFNTTGNENTAVGNNSLYSNTTNSGNTAVGYNSLFANTGWQNTAVGHHSLQLNTTGNYNTALGYNAGSSVTTGLNLTLIGIDANPSSGTAIDQVTLGNGFVSSLRCNVQTITSLSDARDKKNITDLSLGLDFISKLKPRQFNWDKREWYDDNVSDGSKMKEAPTAGFIAQELDEAQTNSGVEWLNLVLKDNPEKWEATPGNLLPIMVKAIQELKSENDEIKAESEKLKVESVELKSENEEMKQRLLKLEQTQNMPVSEIERLKAKDRDIKEVRATNQ